MIRCVKIDTDGEITTHEISPNDPADLQKLVGGYVELIQTREPISVFADEDGVRKHLRQNAWATAWSTGVGRLLLGPIVIAGPPDAEGDLTSIPEEYEKLIGVSRIPRWPA